MSNNQPIDFAMKVQENLISKQNTLSNENKEINAKLHRLNMKKDQLNKGKTQHSRKCIYTSYKEPPKTHWENNTFRKRST